jgi:hypothetical protein
MSGRPSTERTPDRTADERGERSAIGRLPRAGGTLLAELRARNRTLFAVALLNLALAVLFTGLLFLDGRTLLGRNVWTKPWKFAVSITVFTATLGWILPSLSLRERTERAVSAIVAGGMLIEITLISAQAARGVRSHFNTATPLDTAVFAVMGTTITVSTLAVTYALWRAVRDPPPVAPAYRWGLWLGLFVFVLASFEGGLMAARGSHAVGAPADAPGLPLLNWSLTGGDLRIAHFIGLHALQVLPLTGYLAARWRRLSSRGALAAVGTVAALYGALAAVTFVQAMRGVSPLSGLPSATLPLTTVFAASVLLVAPFWALMLLAPTRDLTGRVLGSRLVALPAAGLYVVLLLPQVATVAGAVLSPSLSGMATLLATDAGATLAWVHFLAFDLLVGRWVLLDGRRRGYPAVVLSPVLLATLLFGPAGFAGYWTVRAVDRGR